METESRISPNECPQRLFNSNALKWVRRLLAGGVYSKIRIIIWVKFYNFIIVFFPNNSK